MVIPEIRNYKYCTKQVILFILLPGMLICFSALFATGQSKKARHHNTSKKRAEKNLSAFKTISQEAGIEFKFPEKFKALPAVNNENFSYDYAMTMPGQDFEIWLRVQSLKSNWASFNTALGKGKRLANPDSSYLEVARAQVAALSDDAQVFVRNISQQTLQEFNADAGKTYLINLSNLPETKYYKYALLIALQKNHVGYLMAVCLTNDHGPSFFKNISQARNSIRFK